MDVLPRSHRQALAAETHFSIVLYGEMT
jgi:hypothetical protein